MDLLFIFSVFKGLTLEEIRLEQLISHKISDNEEENKKLLEDLKVFAEQVKTNLFSFIYIPWFTIAILSIFSSCVVLFLLVQYSEGLEQYVIMNSYSRFMMELWNILSLYGFCFLSLMFCWWNWTTVLRGGYIWRIYCVFLAFKIIENLKTNVSHHAKTTKTAQSLIYWNEMCNILMLFLTSCIPDLLAAADELPIFPEISYAVMIYCLNAYYKHCFHNSQLSQNQLKIERSMFIFLILLMPFYEYTQKWESVFFFKTHISAIIIYSASFVILPIYFIFNRRTRDSILPFTLLLMFLHRDSFFDKIWLLMYNYQNIALILPAIELSKIRLVESVLGPRVIKKKKKLY